MGSTLREAPGVDAQDGLFDHQWEDTDLEAALEEREQLRQQRLEVAAEFKRADEAARGKLEGYELAVGEVARVGRFRIKKTQAQSREVSFTTSPQPRLNIKVDDPEE
jgi:hypothetical protein